MAQSFSREIHYINYLKGKTVGIFGYSEDCKDEALLLIDQGINVIIGLRPVDDEWKRAKVAGFEVRSLEDAVEECDIIQVW